MENQQVQGNSIVTLAHTSSDRMSSVDLFEELRFECERRQQEIYQNDTVTIQTATYILAFAGVVMGFVIPSKDIDYWPKLITCIFVGAIAYLGLRQHTSRTQSTYINAAYQKVFIEPKTREVKWETRLSKFRQNPPKSGVIDTVSDLGWLYGGIGFINTLLGFYYLWKINNNILSPLFLMIPMIIVTIIVIFIWYREWAKYALLDERKMEEYTLVWQQIEQEEIALDTSLNNKTDKLID